MKDQAASSKKELLSKLKSKMPAKEEDPMLDMEDDYSSMDTSPAPAADAEAGPGMLNAETDEDLIAELEARGFKVEGDPGPGKRSNPDPEEAKESKAEEDTEELEF